MQRKFGDIGTVPPTSAVDPQYPDRLLAIVLVSGGLDSCVTAAVAAQTYDLAFLHLNYGQRTEKRELQAFSALADHFQVRHRLVTDIQYLLQIGGSSLTDKRMDVPDLRPDLSGSIPNTYVPFRNTHIVAIAVSWAEVIGANKIFIGAVEADSSGYPDCRREYFEAYNRLIKLGTRPESNISIETPLIDYSKEEVVRCGLALKAPLQLTWSCYKNNDIACGCCESCFLRLKGFKLAGATDPVPYNDDRPAPENGPGVRS